MKRREDKVEIILHHLTRHYLLHKIIQAQSMI